eukprot:2588074-Alexandrium_andersonii.AAC.1
MMVIPPPPEGEGGGSSNLPTAACPLLKRGVDDGDGVQGHRTKSGKTQYQSQKKNWLLGDAVLLPMAKVSSGGLWHVKRASKRAELVE